MNRPAPWNRRGRGDVVLVPPDGPRAAGRGRTWVADADRAWELSARRAWAWPVPGVRRVVVDGPTTRLEGRIWVHAVGAESAERSTWSEGVATAAGRIRVVDAWVCVDGGGGSRALDVLGADEQLTVGPGGALAVVGPRGLRTAPPRCTPVDAETPVEPGSLAWSRSGRRLWGLTPEGPVWVDVATRARRDAPLPRPPRTGSCAVNGSRLAGPGGRIWDLRGGRPVHGASIPLGVTLAWGSGFVTVDWESHEGRWIDPERGTAAPFRLPLDDDDTTVAGLCDDAGARFVSAEGRAFAVRGAEVREILPFDVEEPGEVTVESPLGPLAALGTALIDDRRFAWTADGALYGWACDRREGSATTHDQSLASHVRYVL